MTEKEYLDLALVKYKDLQKLQASKNFYEYEKAFDEIWTELGRAVLEKSISEAPADRRKKNTVSVWKNRH
jgi:hypothetical protein